MVSALCGCGLIVACTLARSNGPAYESPIAPNQDLGTMQFATQAVVDYNNVKKLKAAYRIALVVGNGKYESPLPELSTPANDAVAMASLIQKAGFSLIGNGPQINVNFKRFNDLANQLHKAVASHPGALVFIYFSGHGFVADQHNALAMTDTKILGSDASKTSIGVSDLVRGIENAGAEFVMAILDACRQNSAGTLEDEPPSQRAFIGFAAVFGSPALELKGERHSVYTEAFLQEFQKDWIMPEDLHAAISRYVGDKTVQGQVPVYRNGNEAQAIPLGLVIGHAGSNGEWAAYQGGRSPNKLQDQSKKVEECHAKGSDNALWFEVIAIPLAMSGNEKDEKVREALDSVLAACRSAYELGARDEVTLSRMALAIVAIRFRNFDTPIDQSLERISGYLLMQAAEQGDAWGNLFAAYFQARQASIRKSDDEMNVARARALRAARSNTPYLRTLILLMFLGQKNPQLSWMPFDAKATSELIVSAAKDHVALATALLVYRYMLDGRLPGLTTGVDSNFLEAIRGMQVPTSLNIREIVHQTIVAPKEEEEGDVLIPKLMGLSGLDSLVILSASDGMIGLFGEPDPDIFIDGVLRLEPIVAKTRPESGFSSFASMAGCIFSGGLIYSGHSTLARIDFDAAARFFRIAAELGDNNSRLNLDFIMSHRVAPCTINFDKAVEKWRSRQVTAQ
jgi:hypothetical protein